MIIGIDPGTTGACGLAVCTPTGTFSLTLSMTGGSLGEGLGKLRDFIVEHAAEAGSIVVHEKVIHRPRPGSGVDRGVIPLSYVEGIILEAAHRSDAPNVPVAPLELKAAFGVSRNAAVEWANNEYPFGTKNKISTAVREHGKQQMIDAMRALGHDPKNEHEADALALIEYLLRKGQGNGKSS